MISFFGFSAFPGRLADCNNFQTYKWQKMFTLQMNPTNEGGATPFGSYSIGYNISHSSKVCHYETNQIDGLLIVIFYVISACMTMTPRVGISLSLSSNGITLSLTWEIDKWLWRKCGMPHRRADFFSFVLSCNCRPGANIVLRTNLDPGDSKFFSSIIHVMRRSQWNF